MHSESCRGPAVRALPHRARMCSYARTDMRPRSVRARCLAELSESVERFEKRGKLSSKQARPRNESSPFGSGESRGRLVLSAQQAEVPEGIVSRRKLSSELLQPEDELCGGLHFP
jgi:hypothetical protein